MAEKCRIGRGGMSQSADPSQAPDPLTEVPTKPERTTARGTVPGFAPLPIPDTRKPVEYKKPGGGWVTLMVLALAGIGALTVAMGWAQKIHARLTQKPAVAGGKGNATTADPATKPTQYRELPKDDAVLITVEVSPRSARLMLDGEPLPSNPVRVARGTQPHRLGALADGYAPGVEEFMADDHKTIKLRLKRGK